MYEALVSNIIKTSKPKGRPKQFLTPTELKEHTQNYNRTYYHNKIKPMREESICPHCGTKLETYPYLRRHLILSKKCELIRAKKELDAIKQNRFL
jgi:hypothetical protein